MIQYAYFAKVVKKPGRKKKQNLGESSEEDNSASSADEEALGQDEDSQTEAYSGELSMVPPLEPS